MKKRIFALTLALVLLTALLSGCGKKKAEQQTQADPVIVDVKPDPTAPTPEPAPEPELEPEQPAESTEPEEASSGSYGSYTAEPSEGGGGSYSFTSEETGGDPADTGRTEESGSYSSETPEQGGSYTAAPDLDEGGSYTSVADVALYLHTYSHLPDNFITKSEARSLGWTSGGLEKYAPGKCIGGDRFGNREGLLPSAPGRTYTECDINTLGARSRGAERIVFSNDGLIYYTDDHYKSFTLLYGTP